MFFLCFFGNKMLSLSLRMSLVSGHYSTLFDFKGNVEEKLISETATSDGVKTGGGRKKDYYSFAFLCSLESNRPHTSL